MTTIVVTLLISIAAIFGLMVFCIWFLNYCLRVYIGQKHKLLEEMVETNRVPQRWSEPFDRRVERAAGQTEKMDRIRESARATYLRRLSRIEQYVLRSRLVDDEARRILIDSINTIRSEWGSSNHEAYRIRIVHPQAKG